MRLNKDTVQDAAKARWVTMFARIPWPLLWGIHHRLSGSAVGRRAIEWVFPKRKLWGQQIRQLCAALGMTETQIQRELQRGSETVLLRVLLYQLPRLSPAVRNQRYVVEGWEYFENERAQGLPVIFVGSHYGVSRLFPCWVALQGENLLSIEWFDSLGGLTHLRPSTLQVRETHDQFPARLTLEALRVLRAGGCVHTAGDHATSGEQRSRPFTYGGGEVTFPLGMPTLSLLSGAAMIPYFCTLDESGRVRVALKPVIRPRCRPEGLTPEQRQEEIEWLCEQYARVHIAAVEQAPGNLFNNLPSTKRIASRGGSKRTRTARQQRHPPGQVRPDKTPAEPQE